MEYKRVLNKEHLGITEFPLEIAVGLGIAL